jgi:tRNA threonylcarbamoyladenosine biosynthesis protein TsaB
VLIVGIDTSGRQGSVALLQAQGEQLVTLETAVISGGQYSELLVPTLAELLGRHGFQRSSIGLLGVASGPGSFTGLRIAIATVKGLSEAFDTPLVATSVLEALALDITATNPNPALMKREGIASFPDFASLIATGEPVQKLCTSDEELAIRLGETGLKIQVLPRPTAEDYARIAHRKFLIGIHADVATLDANYLRRSDAEIFATPKIDAASR